MNQLKIKMKASGNLDHKIWLLGDSNPTRWQGVLDYHLDERHPARHNIWTPILLKVQDNLFREERLHIDESKFYVRNAIEESDLKKINRGKSWDKDISKQVALFEEELDKNNPLFVFSFGAFAFEFARRAMKRTVEHAFSYWGADRLGLEFRKAVSNIATEQPVLIPLLHATIARGYFLQSHHYFCTGKREEAWQTDGENYFNHTAQLISEKLIAHKDELDIWV